MNWSYWNRVIDGLYDILVTIKKDNPYLGAAAFVGILVVMVFAVPFMSIAAIRRHKKKLNPIQDPAKVLAEREANYSIAFEELEEARRNVLISQLAGIGEGE